MIKTFLKKNWGKLALGLFLFLIVIFNFRWGYFILGNDNYSPEENPAVSVQRYLTEPAWRTYRGLGVPSDSEQIDIFRSVFYLVLEKIGIPLWFISQVSVWLVFAMGPWFIAVLAEKIFHFDKKKYGNWLFVMVGLLYLSNLLFFWLFYSPLKSFILVWGFLPTFLVFSWKLLEKLDLKNSLLFLTVLIGLSTSFIIPTLFIVVTLVVLITYWQFWYLGKNIKKIFWLFGIYMLWQMFWLVPFGLYVKTNSTQLAESIINKEITPSTIQDEIIYNKWNNVPRFLTSWVNTKNDDGKYLFSFSSAYKNNWVLVAISYLPFVLMLGGTVYLIGKYTIKYLPIIVLWWLGYWLIKGSNPPFGNLYVWLQEHIPLFKQVFRWGSSKFWPMMLVSMPLLIGLGIGGLERFKKTFGVVVIGVVVCLLIYIFPVFSGKLINDRDYVKIPAEYYQLKDYLNKTDNKGRIYLAPESNMLYFKNHDWGFFGSVFWSYLIPNPIIEKALITGSAENEDAFGVMTDMYYSENPDLFYRALSNYKIEWVIGDKSLTNKGNGFKYNWDIFAAQIENNPNFEKVGEWGKLSLYKVKSREFATNYRSVYLGHDDKMLIQSKVITNDTNFVLEKKGEIIPILLKPNKVVWSDNGDLVLSHTYEGERGSFIPNFNETNLTGLKISINKSALTVFDKIILKTGDEIEVVVPNINFDIGVQKNFGGGVSINKGQVIINNKNDVSGFYKEISSPSLNEKMMMVAIDAKNVRGIPWELNFRETKQEYKLFRYYGQMETKEQKVMAFTLPNDWRNYLVEVLVYAKGEQTSINKINHFWLGPIENDWLKIKFIPENTSLVSINSNNQAQHPNWTGDDKAAINGWEQGTKDKNPIFWPNYLTWAGLIIDLIIILGCLVFGWRNTFGRAKS